MAVKKNEPKDVRRIAIKWPELNLDSYHGLEDADWRFIEQKLGVKLSSEFRARLSAVTMLYAGTNDIIDSSRSITEVRKAIELWRKRTGALRKFIWPNVRVPDAEQPSLQKIIGQYFHLRPTPQTMMFPLAQFAQFLDGADASASHFLRKLKDPSLVTSRKTEMWLIWAALVISLCRSQNVPIFKRSSVNDFVPGFFVLLEKLQSTLSVQEVAQTKIDRNALPMYRKAARKTRIPVKAGTTERSESLRKNALRALQIAEGDPVDELNGLILLWAWGWTDAHKLWKSEPVMTALLSRLEKEMRSVNQKPI